MTMMNEFIYYKSVPDKNRQTHESFTYLSLIYLKNHFE